MCVQKGLFLLEVVAGCVLRGEAGSEGGEAKGGFPPRPGWRVWGAMRRTLKRRPAGSA